MHPADETKAAPETEQLGAPTSNRLWRVLLFLPPASYYVLQWVYDGSPHTPGPGDWPLKILTAVALLMALLIAALLFLALHGMRPRAAIHRSAWTAWAWLGALSLLWSCFLHDRKWERRIFYASGLAAAVEAFVEEHGRPPATFDELEKEGHVWLDELPSARIAHGEDVPAALRPESGPLAPPWALCMHAGLGSDLFFYLPDARYADYMPGSHLERLGHYWAYLHD